MNNSKTIYKQHAKSYRTRDLVKFGETDYLHKLNKDDLQWYLDNSQDFLYAGNTVDAVRRDVYASNPSEFFEDFFQEEPESDLQRLLKYLGDKRKVKTLLKTILEDEKQAFPEDKDNIELSYRNNIKELNKI